MGKRIEALRIFAYVGALLLLAAGMAMGQAYTNVVDFGPLHHAPLETAAFQVTSGDASSAVPDSIVLQLPSKFDVAHIDTTTGAGIPLSSWVTNRAPLWDGYLVMDLKIVNTDLATDSLQVLAYALDEDGAVIGNDYTYASFATPPTYASTATIKAWTTDVWYRADFTGAFGKGTYGILFVVRANDATASHTGLGYAKFRL
jgi:hypothetical protein